jgi:hypothetical protein
LHIDVTISTFLSNLEINEFSENDLYNLKIVDNAGATFKLLKFDVHLINSENLIALEKPVVIKREFRLKNKENANFTFDTDENSILLTDVKLNIKPTGTKRAVITYEDTDVIDDTM